MKRLINGKIEDMLPTEEEAFNNNLTQNNAERLKSESNYKNKRVLEYPPIQDQLDMMYWDKVNGTTTWKDKITEIKNKYPKPKE